MIFKNYGNGTSTCASAVHYELATLCSKVLSYSLLKLHIDVPIVFHRFVIAAIIFGWQPLGYHFAHVD